MVIMTFMKIRFGEFVLDEPRFLLERQGERVALRPKVFDLLVRLARHRDRVVRREELIQHLWGTTAVGAGSLSGLVNELRQALGEDGRGPSSIRTVHARGYQFVARVEQAEASGHDAALKATARGERSETFSALIERVAEHGACGIVLAGEAAQGFSSRAERAGFEVCRLFAPEASLASPSRFAAQVIASMIESRGHDAVCKALPLPARVGFETIRSEAFAGGSIRSSRIPGAGLGAVASLLSDCARRRPLVMWLDEIERSGVQFVKDLVSLVRRLGDAPVLWVATTKGGEAMEASEAALRVLEGEGNFERWLESDGHSIDPPSSRLQQSLRRRGLDSLPDVLAAALVAHARGDDVVLAEIVQWMGEEAHGQPGDDVSASPERSARMLRVEPQMTPGRLRSVDS
jgi:DNA-binding winged helix-turn-helix (wHTH) protein